MTTPVDVTYAKLVKEILEGGQLIETRNAKAYRLLAVHVVFGSTPLVAVRKTSWKNALREWEWFMSGSSRIEDLHPSVRSWWQPWMGAEHKVHNNYSEQFRAFHGLTGVVDQVGLLIDGIKNHPYSRRNVITTWNTADMHNEKTAITNCHGTVIQCFVDLENKLHLVTYQRSADVICGLPHNWLQYWAFLMWLARRSNRGVGTFTWIGGDVHVYEAHKSLAIKIMETVDEIKVDTPDLVYQPSREDFKADDFSLVGDYQPVINERAEMIV